MARPIQDSVVLATASRRDRTFLGLFTPGSVNRGYGGYNTIMGFPIMDQFLAHKDEAHLYSRIRLMTVWFGTNDAAPPHLPLQQHVPVKEYTENLHKILDTLTSNEKYPAIPNIILITPPPMHQPGIHPDEPIRRDWEATKTYVDAAKKVGEEWRAKAGKGQADWRIATVSAWDAVIEAAGGTGDQLAPFFTDGLHLSTRGYDAVWAKISDIVKNDFQGRGVDWDDAQNLPLTLPDWGLLDKSSPDNVVKGMKGGYRRESSA